LETPVPVVDLDILKAKFKRLQAYPDQHEILVIAQNKSMPAHAISLQHVFSTTG
jgi:D-serine deaminase-like pyridoxal phosphate-dependent protein